MGEEDIVGVMVCEKSVLAFITCQTNQTKAFFADLDQQLNCTRCKIGLFYDAPPYDSPQRISLLSEN
jgi:hypothetical protein